MLRTLSLVALVSISLFGSTTTVSAAEPVQQVRLYTLDCGEAVAKNLGAFSDTGEYDGKSGKVVDPCFVIRHPKGVLLWDTGLGDGLVGKKAPDDGDFVLNVKVTLVSQLEQLGLKPADVTYMAFSHFHFDHIGNATLFPGATWILNGAEVAAMDAKPPVFEIGPEFRKTMAAAKQKVIHGDLDVFGDGSVRILKAPGHTPGHQVLALKLQKAGVMILSGDLYHLRDSRQFRRVPAFNHNRADTLASFDRIETIVKNTKARFVVQHDPVDFNAMPKFPAYLD